MGCIENLVGGDGMLAVAQYALGTENACVIRFIRGLETAHGLSAADVYPNRIFMAYEM